MYHIVLMQWEPVVVRLQDGLNAYKLDCRMQLAVQYALGDFQPCSAEDFKNVIVVWLQHLTGFSL